MLFINKTEAWKKIAVLPKMSYLSMAHKAGTRINKKRNNSIHWLTCNHGVSLGDRQISLSETHNFIATLAYYVFTQALSKLGESMLFQLFGYDRYHPMHSSPAPITNELALFKSFQPPRPFLWWDGVQNVAKECRQIKWRLDYVRSFYHVWSLSMFCYRQEGIEGKDWRQ